MSLVENGLRVMAVPLDPVICATAATSGVETVPGTLEQARANLGNMRFDCVLYLNVLHLMKDPVQVISIFRDVTTSESSIIIQTPNMRSLPAVWDHARIGQVKAAPSYQHRGVHFTSKGKVRKWCNRAGYSVSRTTGLLHRRVASFSGLACSTTGLLLAREIISFATRKEL
jgi:tRNA U34 5-methylaminomethyl-2-thiouridine-forming methyltransferase MnmC